MRIRYFKRNVKPKRATNTTRFILVWLSRWFEWRKALAVGQPETFTRWHRERFRIAATALQYNLVMVTENTNHCR